ncbi:ABC transporter C family member 3-like isoform X2 [Magnolia sinica]|uniref:ABC transporter C family member 3-like isoform X2 n=1 Tax=Magnolia sinica TaxID=86752 RepID=UPI002659B541|nr:ABC transporter C family member 3-like isoform X2 [Magnolia sinica]
MDVLYGARNGMSMFLLQPYVPMHTSSSFLLQPNFLHGFSFSSHLVFVLVLSITWAIKRSKMDGHQHSKERLKNSNFLYYKPTLFSSLCLSLFYLILCIFNCSVWNGHCWSHEKLPTQLDLVLRTFVWFVISMYLHVEFYRSKEKKFPMFLRVWWNLYFFMCCSFIIIDLVFCRKLRILPTHLWVLDFGSVLIGSFLCYAGFFGKRDEEETPLLEEPLLNGGACKKSAEDDASPYSNASFLSILTFSWAGHIISAGNKKTLDLGDVPLLADDDRVNGVFSVFRDKLEWDSRNCHSDGIGTLKLSKALFLSVWKEVLWSCFFSLLYTFTSYVGPYLIDAFVQHLDGYQEFQHEGYVLVSAFIAAKLVECLAQRHWFFRIQRAGMRGRAALVAMIFHKGLLLSSQSRQGNSCGEIINLISVDAEMVGEFSWYMIDLWLVPTQVGLALLILYKNLGPTSLVALVASIAVMLANIPFGKLEERFQTKMMEAKDMRMKSMSEIMRNMRTLKLQGWEMRFLSRILELRKVETAWLKKKAFASAVATFLYYGAPTFMSVAAFGACLSLGVPLTPGRILSAVAAFRILQEPIYNLPDTISVLAQTKVSLDRIASFLRLNELPPVAVEKLPEASEVAIKINNGCFSWDLSTENPTLKDLNFQVLHGMRVAVCGAVGSGKSSLLSCILGEVPKISGTIEMMEKRAYVAQSPWIQSGTVQDNVLFGKEMDRERYERVLGACLLKKDLEILPFRDQTIIGERGINLSGGQKQRIQIARALYQDADIYLFDDPFSAVDAHTGTHLFKECLLGLLRSKTVIFVTHQVEFLPYADLILVMRDGMITQAGKYNDNLNSGTDFMELVGAHKKALSTLDSMETSCNTQQLTAESSSSHMKDGLCNIESRIQELSKEEERDQLNGKTDEITGQNGQLIQEEEREKGNVGLSVYWKYVTELHGGALVPLILLAQILFLLLQIASNYWMAWAAPVSEDAEPRVRGSLLIVVYVVLALGSSICVLVRALIQAIAGYKTATLLFNKMHTCLFRAPMSFFDATPSGRILNRASTDQSAVDVSIPFQIGSVAFSIIQLLGIIAVMSQVAWQVFVVFIPTVAACIWYQRYYITAARELSRFVGVRNAPIIQHFAESISGLTTIRSFNQESRFMRETLHLIDGHSQPKFHNASAMEWLCFRLDMLSSITFAFSLVIMISMPMGVINPSIAGLAVTYGLNLNALQALVIWNLSNLDNKIISVERILQYTCIPRESPLVVEANRPDRNWPSDGQIDVNDLQVRYAPHMPLVLKGLTCSFAKGMKIGIVGRTGSGKSTLIQTLFRIIEPASGQILIDGVDISTIGLHDLRSRLSIIPQDPTMFEGTVRSNLDPLEEYTDEQIWEALVKCHLREVSKKEEKLYSAVAENGENWSMGQRQLVCLGRVLLKKSKVLVLDEATASVDTVADNLIQRTLKQHFSNSTVITIAHRISSVLDSDKVLLLDNGLLFDDEEETFYPALR